MKRIFFLILLFVSLIVFGQSEKLKQDSIYFEKISTIDQEIEDLIFNSSSYKELKNKEEYLRNLYKKNLENYHYFLSTFPNSEYTFSVLSRKAEAEAYLKDYANSKASYLKIIQYINDNRGKTEPSNGFDEEDNKRLFNWIYKQLASIEMTGNNYTQALKYLDEAQKNSYRISCGNGFFSEVVNIANTYSECYLNLKEDEKICDVLIPVSAIPVADENSITITRLYETLLKKYKKEDLKNLFKESFKTLHSKEGIINGNTDTIYYVRFLNRDVILYDLSFKNLTPEATRERLNKILNYSKFYVLLSK